MASMEATKLLAAAAAACEDKKAEDIRILKLDPTESGLTDYFLICTGLNDRQNVAITDEVELRLKREFNTYPNSVEGRRQGDWVLMDYVDFIVHVFSAEKRAFYGLERLRKTATSLSLEELNTELKAQIAEVAGSRKTAKSVSANKSAAGEKTLPAKKSSAKQNPAKKAVSAQTLVRSTAKKASGTTNVAAKKAAAKKTT